MLAAWQDGDEVAGSRLVRRHFDSLYRFFRTRVGEQASDLIQRTLLACVEARDRFPADASFKPFLMGIARKQLLMFLRKERRRDAAHARVADEADAVLSSLSGKVAIREEQRLLLKALRSLPLDVQMTLELHYWEGMAISEIAEVLELAPSSVKTRLYRARRQLHSKIMEMAPGDGATTVAELDKWARSLQRLLAPDSGEDYSTQPT